MANAQDGSCRCRLGDDRRKMHQFERWHSADNRHGGCDHQRAKNHRCFYTAYHWSGTHSDDRNDACDSRSRDPGVIQLGSSNSYLDAADDGATHCCCHRCRLRISGLLPPVFNDTGVLRPDSNGHSR